MSYGFLVKNTVGEVLLDENFNCVQFLGKIPLTYDNSGPTVGSSLSEYTYTGNIAVPNTTSGVVYFMTVPSSTSVAWYETAAPYSTGYNTTINYVTVRTAAGTSYTVPELYAFTTNNHKIPTVGNYGIQLRNSADIITFDSRNTPLSISSLGLNITYSAAPGTATTFSGLPAKPAFLIPYFYRQNSIRYSGDYEYRGTVRRDGNTMYAYLAITSADLIDSSSLPTYTDNIGSITAQVPFINAALYD